MNDGMCTQHQNAAWARVSSTCGRNSWMSFTGPLELLSLMDASYRGQQILSDPVLETIRHTNSITIHTPINSSVSYQNQALSFLFSR